MSIVTSRLHDNNVIFTVILTRIKKKLESEKIVILIFNEELKKILKITVKIMILSRYRPITVPLPFSGHRD